MKKVEINGLAVQGVKVRTCNADEAQPANARIGRLWADFGLQVAPHMSAGARVYGVYHRYASDANGAFDVLAGTDALVLATADASPLSQVDIETGTYLVFEAPGAMPQAVIDAWARIWRYFSDPQCPHARAYTTDFECYLSDAATDIYIAVRPS